MEAASVSEMCIKAMTICDNSLADRYVLCDCSCTPAIRYLKSSRRGMIKLCLVFYNDPHVYEVPINDKVSFCEHLCSTPTSSSP